MGSSGRAIAQAVSRRFSPRRPRFVPRSVHVGFIVNKVALGLIFLRVLRCSPVNIIPLLIHNHSCIIWRGGGSGQRAVRSLFSQRHSLTPSIATITSGQFRTLLNEERCYLYRSLVRGTYKLNYFKNVLRGFYLDYERKSCINVHNVIHPVFFSLPLFQVSGALVLA